MSMDYTYSFLDEMAKYARNPQKLDKQGDLYKEWKSFINMSAVDLERFLYHWSDEAILTPSEALKEGLRTGKEATKAIIRMKRRKKSEWSKNDWEWAKRHRRFIKRFTSPTSDPLIRSPKNNLFTLQGFPTKYYLSLLLWGYDPMKNSKVGHQKIY